MTNQRKGHGIPKVTAPKAREKELPRVDLEKVGEGKITFSYTFLDLQHEAFNCGGTDPGWFVHLHENLCEISRLTPNEFRFQMRNHFDVHGHNFDKLAYSYQLPGDMLGQVESDCVQFRLSSAGGRVHGFFIENILYIVWLDPHHNLYPSQRHGGEKFFDKHLTPYDKLVIESDGLRKKVEELEGMLEEATRPDKS